MRIILDLQGAQSESRFRGIGRYSLALARAIAREAKQHEVWLALSGRYRESVEPLREEFAHLMPRERIRVFELPGPVAELDSRNAWRMQAAELLREKFLADLRPDIVHMSTMFEGFHNEVAASVGRLSKNLSTAVTLYDLIPLRYPEKFLADPDRRRWYLRRAQSLKRADLLLAISESSRREAIETLQILPERITNIGSGVSPFFSSIDVSPASKSALLGRLGLRKPFVLYTGNIEPHKNLERLIEAFSLLPGELRKGHQLVVVGNVNEEERRRLISRYSKKFSEKEIVFAGYASDEDLRLLYRTCTLFVLPSLHEGFGLPLVEAMACGAAVIGSNLTSIPEIIDRPEALFNPHCPQAIADCISMVLSNAEVRQGLQEWGRERSRAFTWESCGRKALAALETLNAESSAKKSVILPPLTGRRPTLAFVSPLPPAETPLAEYAAKALPILSRYYDIVCISDQSEVRDDWITAEYPVRDLDWFKTKANSFERVLYQFGNSSWQKHILEFIVEHPGVVELHDLFIGETLDWMDRSGYASGFFVRFLYDSHGFFALKKDRDDGRAASIRKFPCNAPIFRASIGVIVHSDETPELVAGGDWFAAQDLYGGFAGNSSDGDGLEAFPSEKSAERYAEAIEDIYSTSFQAREQELLRAIARTEAPATPTEADLAALAVAIAANRTPFGPRQILVDVTILARADARTGIQRVTRAILLALIGNPPAGYRIEPVRASDGKYFYARRFTCRCLSLPDDKLSDDPVEARNGDIFLGLDLCFEFIPDLVSWFELQRCRGVAVNFVVYDILPQTRPEFFHPQMVPAVRRWLETLARIADRLVCISRTVADEVAEWLSNLEPHRKRPLSIGFFHLGADLRASLPITGLISDASSILNAIRCRPSFLIVGTIEPRKGHCQAVAAMEKLWEAGTDANLVIVGKPGWLMEDFEKEIKNHQESGKRLFWLQDISDEMLEELYRSAAALLVPSEGEGFGLPLIEAAQFGLPIVARDLPVFREVAGESAYYFSGSTAEALADALQRWLALGDAAPKSSEIPWLTWEQSSRQLLDALLDERWYRYWPDKDLNYTKEAPVGLKSDSAQLPPVAAPLKSN
jgi:glycosyltransferase involved in cell wall biosynthesis